MTIEKHDLRQCLRQAPFLLQGASTAFKSVNVEGVTGYYCPVSHPHVNMVGLKPGIVLNNGIVDRVIDVFDKENLAFGWLLDHERVEEQEEILKLKGLVPHDGLDALYSLDIENLSKLSDKFQVKVVEMDDKELFWQVLSQAMGVPIELTRYFGNAIMEQDKLQVFDYLAYEGEMPVGAASMVLFPDRPVAKLAAAAVLKPYRLQGAYKSIIANRVVHAASLNVEAVVVLALSNTSAPICQRAGFKKAFSSRIYAWEPQRKRG